MTTRKPYAPGPAGEARIEKHPGEQWTLVLVRQLRHAPVKVWDALTDPEQLRQWAPFDASGNLGQAGVSVQLTTVGAPMLSVSETIVTRSNPPHELIYNWGANDMRWVLEPENGGTRLTLWTSIDRRYIAMGAAGWHLCFDVLDHLLAGEPMGRMAGVDVMKFDGWQRLHAEYKQKFSAESTE